MHFGAVVREIATGASSVLVKMIDKAVSGPRTCTSPLKSAKVVIGHRDFAVLRCVKRQSRRIGFEKRGSWRRFALGAHYERRANRGPRSRAYASCPASEHRARFRCGLCNLDPTEGRWTRDRPPNSLRYPERAARHIGAPHAVPTIFQFHAFTAAGGLMSYGSSDADAYRLGRAETSGVCSCCRHR
jgi:hypothetical protein